MTEGIQDYSSVLSHTGRVFLAGGKHTEKGGHKMCATIAFFCCRDSWERRMEEYEQRRKHMRTLATDAAPAAAGWYMCVSIPCIIPGRVKGNIKYKVPAFGLFSNIYLYFSIAGHGKWPENR